MMRVLHVVPRLGVPSQSFIKTLITSMSGEIDCQILTTRVVDGHGFGEIPVRQIESLLHRPMNALLRRLQGKEPEQWIERPYFIGNKVEHAINTSGCQIVHCHFGQALYMLALACGDQLQCPVIASFHGTDATALPMQNTNYKTVIQTILTNHPVLISVPSKYLKEQFLAQFCIAEERVNVVPNSFSTSFLNTDSSLPDASDKTFRIVCIGRFIDLKGHQYLVQAFASFIKSHPNAELILIGTEEGNLDIDHLLNAHGVDKYTTVYRDLSHEKIPLLLESASAYVQPSIVDKYTGQCESFCVAALEALVMGLPTILTRTGGMADLIEEKFFPQVQGIEAADTAQILEALYTVARCDDDGQKSQAANYYRRKYSPENTFSSINQMYLAAADVDAAVATPAR